MELKSSRTAKEMINKMKRQPKEKEKIFGNNISDNRLVSTIDMKLKKLNSKKKKDTQTIQFKNGNIFPTKIFK